VNSGISKRFLWVTFGLKFLASLLLFYIYTAHYTERTEADIFKYFDDSEVIADALTEHPTDYIKLMMGVGIETDYYFDNYYVKMNNWDRAYDSNVYNDSHTIIRFNAFVRLFSFGNFHIHSLFFSLLSMIGLVALYKVFQVYFERLKTLLLMLLFFTPSVFLWTSGVLKESILIFAIGSLFYGIHKMIYHPILWKVIIGIALSFFLLIYMKFYVLIAFLPSIICFIVVRYAKKYEVTLYIAIFAFFGLIAFNAKHIPPHIDMVKTLARKQQDFKRLAEWQNAGSVFELTDIDQSFVGIMKVVPEGVLNCFIRPLPTNANSVLYYPAIIENGIVLVLILLVIFGMIKSNLVHLNHRSKNLLLFTIFFTFTLFAIIGVTTPVAGALVRYKVPVLPFLIMGLLLVLQHNKFLNAIELDLLKMKLIKEK